MAADPRNMDLRHTWVVLQRALAKLDADIGEEASARRRLREVAAAVGELTRFDPANGEWRKQEVLLARDLSNLTADEEQKGSPNERQ
jgi:hypothetical protein